MIKAEEFIAKNKYPNWTQIHRVVEGAESVYDSIFNCFLYLYSVGDDVVLYIFCPNR